MAQSKYASNRETTNFARISRIILGPCTDVLCALLTKEIRPSDLPKQVQTFLAKLPKQKTCPITKEQENLINKANYSDFDITLLYFLLRNISNIPPHTNKWGNVPSSRDRSVSANIEKIRLIRNEFGHSSEISISETDFNNKWQEIFNIVRDIESYIGNLTIYQDAVRSIKTCSMDPDQIKEYINELIELNKKLLDISEEVQQIKTSIIPWNVKVIYEKNITNWRGDDNLYIETHTFDKMLEKVLSQPFMTFVGASGSGKTATVHHIALKLQEEGYEILPITDIGHLETYCDPYNPQVFIIENALGPFGLDMSAFCMLNNFFKNSEYPPMLRTKVLMTCREIVFNNKMVSISVLSNKANVIFLNGEEHKLNVHDKHKLLSIYKIETNMLTTGDLASSSNMFPLLCKLFSTEDCKMYGPSFFITPIPCILKKLKEMSMVHETEYASLVLLMANQNRLSKDILDNTKSDENSKFSNELKFQILAACKVKSSTDSFCFIDALLQMVGKYTKVCESEFTFIHESLLEIVAYHFGSQNPNLMLQCMDSDFIANNVKLETCDDGSDGGVGNENPIDLRIKVCNFKMLAERLYSDVRRGELYNVFGNKALKHSPVLKAFIGLMEKESFEKLHSVFLSELQTNIVKHIYAIIKKDDRLDLSVNFNINFLLVGLGRFFDGSVRAISWVVYYGHDQILQCIIDKIMKKKRNSILSDTFKKTEKRHSDRKLNDTVKRELDKATIEQYRLLCLACYSGDLNTVRILLKHVFKKRIINGEIGCHKIPGMEPLVIACFHGYFSIAKELLNAGASVNLKSYYWTPLAAASYRGHLRLVEELLKAGADVNIGLWYKSPIELARFAKHNDIVDKLEAAKSDVVERYFVYQPRSITVLSPCYIREHVARTACSVPARFEENRMTFL